MFVLIMDLLFLGVVALLFLPTQRPVPLALRPKAKRFFAPKPGRTIEPNKIAIAIFKAVFKPLLIGLPIFMVMRWGGAPFWIAFLAFFIAVQLSEIKESVKT